MRTQLPAKGLVGTGGGEIMFKNIFDSLYYFIFIEIIESDTL